LDLTKCSISTLTQKSWSLPHESPSWGMGGTISVVLSILEQNLKLYFKTYIMNTKLMIAIVDDDPIFQFIAKRFIESFESVNQTLVFLMKRCYRFFIL
jgi:hypothetical protein